MTPPTNGRARAHELVAQAVDATMMLDALAQLDCPSCPHQLGQHELSGACAVAGCDCNGYVSVAFIEPDEFDPDADYESRLGRHDRPDL